MTEIPKVTTPDRLRDYLIKISPRSGGLVDIAREVWGYNQGVDSDFNNNIRITVNRIRGCLPDNLNLYVLDGFSRYLLAETIDVPSFIPGEYESKIQALSVEWQPAAERIFSFSVYNQSSVLKNTFALSELDLVGKILQAQGRIINKSEIEYNREYLAVLLSAIRKKLVNHKIPLQIITVEQRGYRAEL
ncbi:MAG: helix-turn-helix domain-containing protein [Candidatus Beckwithbacteria bacterium]